MDGDKKVAAKKRKDTPSPTDAPASKKPCLRDLRSLKEEYESIIDLSYDGDDSTSTESMNLQSFDITITDEDYPVKQKKKKKKSSSGKKESDQGNVPKLTDSFKKGGFVDSSSFANKVKDEDIAFVADANKPLIPYTREMQDAKNKLEVMKDEAEYLFKSVAASGGDVASIDDVGNYLKKVKASHSKLDMLITTVKRSISVVESVRKTSDLLMAACLKSSDDMTESSMKWGKLLSKATLMLQLVEEEKKRALEEEEMERKRQASVASQSATLVDDPEVQIVEPAAEESSTAAAADNEVEGGTPLCIELPEAANGARKGRKTKTKAPTQEERAKSNEKNHISFKQFKLRLSGGARQTHPPLHGQGLEWKNGMVFCTVCNHGRITQERNIPRHCDSDTHKANLEMARSSKTPLYQEGLNFVDRNAMGSHQDTSTLEYRMKALRAAALYNVPITNICGIAKDWVDEYAKESLGNRSDFVSLAAPALHKALTQRIQNILGGAGCYDEFAVTFDGTPSFAEAEAIVVRIVSKDWDVIELLVRCGLYAKKLDANELKSHLIDTITNRVGLELKHWLSTHQDRAKTNKAALKKVWDEETDAKPAENDCCSHTISNAGKQTLGDKGKGAFAESFRKMFQAIINQPGVARNRASEVMGETVKRAGGVRFFQKLEQVMQINDCTPEKVIDEIVKHCIEKKASPESAAKMLHEFDPSTEAKANLAMAIVELAAISGGLKAFVEACYTLEGDSCIILRALDVFKRIEKEISAGFDTPDLEAAVARAVGLIEEVESDWTAKCNEANEAAAAATATTSAAKAKVDKLMEEKASLTSNTTRTGRIAQRTNRSTDMEALEKLLDKIVDAKMDLRSAKSAEKIVKDEADALHKSFEEWKEKFPHRTPNALIAHGKAILKPAGDYYEKLFLDEEGDCFNIRKMSEACLIFDPIELSKMTDTDIVVTNHKRADLLKYFRYKHFDDRFIDRLKKEMSALVKEAKRDHDLGRIPSSKAFKTRLQERIRRKKPADGEDIPWEKDAGEYSERIWQWWKARRDDFPLHALALRLVVLAQLSSCSVERVFSKLKIIRERCGENTFDDMCEVRLFLQCNGDLTELVEKMKKYNE